MVCGCHRTDDSDKITKTRGLLFVLSLKDRMSARITRRIVFKSKSGKKKINMTPHELWLHRTRGRKNRSSPIVSPDIRSNRTNRNSIQCTSLGKRSADMWRKMSLARVESVRGSGPVHLNPEQTVEIGIEEAFDQGRLLSFVFCRVVFAK
jgi:hypothetical protein